MRENLTLLMCKQFNAQPNCIFRQLENLARTSVAMSNIAQQNGVFMPVSLIPEVVQGVNKQTFRDLRFVLAAKFVHRFCTAFAPARTLSHFF